MHTTGTPWAVELLGPQRVWPLTTGRGVRVAVLGTGVDADNAQFGPDQVETGTDVLAGQRGATDDCDGRGTFAAGLIAAQPNDQTTMVGLAPGVTVLPVRYTQATRQGNGAVDPDRLAAAIDAAVTARAKVICVVVPATADSPALRTAVTEALDADVVVVSPAAPGAQSRGGISYPTALPGVLAVGAFGPDGAAVSPESGEHIRVAAPGRGLVSLAAGTNRLGHTPVVDDPAYAAAYVAGTVALVRAYRPGLPATEVVARIEATADRVAVAGRHPQLGWGMVNPYRAVTAEGIGSTPPSGSAGPEMIAAARPAPDDGTEGLVVPLVLAGLGVAVATGIGTVVVRRGRARGWHPGP
ncbi:S8 family serine peptidase [Micromonospora polyrhachis]|uniref:Peptidase S8/S53 domain-containing protein n=1 Tax=Micromonospora polyrhachis TaxID=1282883 RepID=A0A7W7SQT9_9ACTN|nr:S8 family serine peptidase [Micromonospora polyrhachis]MBB4959260.1 hypothetical protein [Micromonospora polyrhachis]